MKTWQAVGIVLLVSEIGFWVAYPDQARSVARWTYVTLWTHAPGSKDQPVPPRFLP
jgi:hypothetical protein